MLRNAPISTVLYASLSSLTPTLGTGILDFPSNYASVPLLAPTLGSGITSSTIDVRVDRLRSIGYRSTIGTSSLDLRPPSPHLLHTVPTRRSRRARHSRLPSAALQRAELRLPRLRRALLLQRAALHRAQRRTRLARSAQRSGSAQRPGSAQRVGRGRSTEGRKVGELRGGG